MFAGLSVALAILLTTLMLFWAYHHPENVLIGLAGRHDFEKKRNERLADCLDCHVPFVGTPGSRCLGPGCHGDLATGTPPRQGAAMPIRFHVVLRDEPCSACHKEHVGRAPPERTFSHDIIPEAHRKQCSKCHSAVQVKDHARVDAVSCELCHTEKQWTGTSMVHANVKDHPCDLCHKAPEDENHASVAGTCADCHETGNWKNTGQMNETRDAPLPHLDLQEEAEK